MNKGFLAGGVNLLILLHVFGGLKSQCEPRVLVLVNESNPQVPPGR